MLGIVGSGALGCLWAAQLYKQTELCFVITEPYRQKRNLSPPFKDLLFDAFSSDASLPPRKTRIPQLTSEQSIGPCSTVLVMTKSYDVDAAINALQPHLGPNNTVVLFQNGMGSQQRTCDTLGNVPCFAAVTTEGANKPKAHTLIHAGRGETTIGPLNKAAVNIGKGQWLEELTLSGLTLHYDVDITKRLFFKLAINCAINPYTAICKCTNGDVRQQALFKTTWNELRSELTCLLNHTGIDWTEKALETRVFDVMKKTSKNQSSMLQDINNDRPTEIDDINGFAYQYLEQHGLPCAINRSLTEQVHALRN